MPSVGLIRARHFYFNAYRIAFIRKLWLNKNGRLNSLNRPLLIFKVLLFFVLF
jgi:hypothetical protein